jgi:hypothetical protein
MSVRHFLGLAAGLFSGLFWGGCAGRPVRGPVTAPPAQTRTVPENGPLAHLEGAWENAGKNGKTRKIVFEPGGRVTFQGGLEFFNPGQWELDPGRQELRMLFPAADDDKLQIFQMYVGDGVKAFDRAAKQVTYHFDDQTWMLNVGGWAYSKADKTAIEAPSEPVLK